MMLPSLSRLALIQVHNTGVGTYDVLNEDEQRYWIEKVVNNINEFDNAPEYIQTNREFLLRVVRYSFELLGRLPPEFIHDQAFMLDVVSKGPEEVFDSLPNEMIRDADFMLAAGKRRIQSLRSAHRDLRNDPEFIRAAVQKVDAYAIAYASQELYRNHDFMIDIVTKFPRAVQYTRMYNDRAFVLEAVKINPSVLRYTHKSVKGDREVVMAAVQKNGEVYYEAMSPARNDPDVVLAAVTEIGDVFRGLDFPMKNNIAIVMAAIRNGEVLVILQYVPDALKNNADVVSAAIEKTGNSFQYASEELQQTFEMRFAAATTKNDPLIGFIPELTETLSKRAEYAVEHAYNARKKGLKAESASWCEKIKIIESNADQLIFSVSTNQPPGEAADEIMGKLINLNAFLGDITKNPCIRNKLDQYKQGKRQRTEEEEASSESEEEEDEDGEEEEDDF